MSEFRWDGVVHQERNYLDICTLTSSLQIAQLRRTCPLCSRLSLYSCLRGIENRVPFCNLCESSFVIWKLAKSKCIAGPIPVRSWRSPHFYRVSLAQDKTLASPRSRESEDYVMRHLSLIHYLSSTRSSSHALPRVAGFLRLLPSIGRHRFSVLPRNFRRGH